MLHVVLRVVLYCTVLHCTAPYCAPLQTRTLAEAQDWDGLEAFAAKRSKSPVGWEPFLEFAQRFGAPKEYQAKWGGAA